MAHILLPSEIRRIVTSVSIEYIMPGQVGLVSKYTGTESILTSGEGYYVGEMAFGPAKADNPLVDGELFLSLLRGRENTVHVPLHRQYLPATLTVKTVNKATRLITVGAPTAPASNTVLKTLGDPAATFTALILLMGDNNTASTPSTLSPFGLNHSYLNGVANPVFEMRINNIPTPRPTRTFHGRTVTVLYSLGKTGRAATGSNADAGIDVGSRVAASTTFANRKDTEITFIGIERHESSPSYLIIGTPSKPPVFDEIDTYGRAISGDSDQRIYIYPNTGSGGKLDFAFLDASVTTDALGGDGKIDGVDYGGVAYSLFRICQPVLLPRLTLYNGAFFTYSDQTRRTRIVDIERLANGDWSVHLEPFPEGIEAGGVLTPTREILTRGVRSSTGSMTMTPHFRGPWAYQWREAI